MEQVFNFSMQLISAVVARCHLRTHFEWWTSFRRISGSLSFQVDELLCLAGSSRILIGITWNDFFFRESLITFAHNKFKTGVRKARFIDAFVFTHYWAKIEWNSNRVQSEIIFVIRLCDLEIFLNFFVAINLCAHEIYFLNIYS